MACLVAVTPFVCTQLLHCIKIASLTHVMGLSFELHFLSFFEVGLWVRDRAFILKSVEEPQKMFQ